MVANTPFSCSVFNLTHQILAHALGGEVGYHPKCKELGTVEVTLTEQAKDDKLFAGLPSTFLAHATHYQSVLVLPVNAIALAGNDFENHHAFRFGDCTWGVQFHPEFTADILKAYVNEQADKFISEGLDVTSILANLKETPIAGSILQNFLTVVQNFSNQKNS